MKVNLKKVKESSKQGRGGDTAESLRQQRREILTKSKGSDKNVTNREKGTSSGKRKKVKQRRGGKVTCSVRSRK
jgi:hypothetical protein